MVDIREDHYTKVVGVENEEVELYLKRCWVIILKNNLFMKEVKKKL